MYPFPLCVICMTLAVPYSPPHLATYGKPSFINSADGRTYGSSKTPGAPAEGGGKIFLLGSRRMLPIGSPTASQMAPRQPDLEHPMVTRGELLTAGRGTGGRSAGYTSTVSEETVESAEWRAVGAQTTVGGRARRRPRAERWLGLAPQLCVGIGGQYGSGGGASERPARTEYRSPGGGL